MAVSTKCPSTWDKFLDSLGLALDVVGLGTIGQSYSSSSTQTLTFTFNPCLRVLYFLGLFHNGWKREKSKLEQIWYWIANAPPYNIIYIYIVRKDLRWCTLRSLSKDKVGIERISIQDVIILPVFTLRYLISKNVPDVKTKVMMLEDKWRRKSCPPRYI